MSASDDLDTAVILESVHLYPIKSCAGIAPAEALPIETGFDLDRAWMVVDGAGEFVTQRELPRMALIRPTLKGEELILRAPGIYAEDRLPVERLTKGTPALTADDDVYTNHVHADDLARMVALALFRSRPNRVYHAVDDTDLKMGEYFDVVADAFGLSRPPRLPRAELEQAVSPMLLSFMSESRRLVNERIKHELGMRLRYCDVHTLLRGQK